MSHESRAALIIDDWFNSRDLYQDGLPAKGTVAAALHVLERLKVEFDLDVQCHLAKKGAQIAGLSGKRVSQLLLLFGEERTLSAVGGRSNRGTPGDIAALLQMIHGLNLSNENKATREHILTLMQEHLVRVHICKYFAIRRVKAVFNANSATSTAITSIIDDARHSGKAGAVAEHLVGAKLALRFPHIVVRNKGYAVKDQQHGFAGDFEIGTTVFHVTMSPMPELFTKLRDDIASGRRVYLIVPAEKVEGSRQNADTIGTDRIEVVAVETFIATNIDEMAEFDGNTLRSGFRRLLMKYNDRVAEVEVDNSLLIDIPQNI